MASLSSPGLGSGLDINGLITKLMTVEQAPLTALAKSEASYQAKLSAYGTMKSALSTFKSGIADLKSASTFNTQSASIGDSDVATATASSSAINGSYSLEVTTLAQAHKLYTASTYSTTGTSLGSEGDTITIDFGSYSAGVFTLNPEKGTKSVSLAAGQNTVSGVRDAINSADIGVTASIINDGAGYRLLLTSSTGASNALRITTTGGLGDLAYDASTGGLTSMTQSQAAQDATLEIDGISVSQSSNTITDAIDGVTLTLKDTNSGSPTTISVSRNTTAAETAIKGFVTAFNTANTSLRSLTAYDATTKKGAILQGDSTALSVMSALRNTLNTTLSYADGGLLSLSDVGISFNVNGTLSLNTTTLATALADSSKDFASLFAATGKASDSLIAYTSSTEDTQPGQYSVNIKQIATSGILSSNVSQAASTNITDGKGKTTGSVAAGLTIDGTNDTFTVTVDGVLSSAIVLTHGTYANAGALAAELQAKINADTGIGSVTVRQSAGILTVTSDTSGATSNVSFTASAATTNLLGVPTTTAGTTANNTLSLTVDGIDADITLANGTYTNANLILMLQAAINGNSDLSEVGAEVTATIGATKGRAVGSTAAELTIDATNDTFTVTVDGVLSGTITLSQDTYTEAELVAELQTQINADATLSAASKSVTVTQADGIITVTSDSTGTSSNVTFTAGAATTDLLGSPTNIAGVANGIILTSNSFGSGSAISISGGSAYSLLFGTVSESTAGLDVAGTIGGATATGFGKYLTSTAGDATGLKLMIDGGDYSLTGEDRGTFSYERGFGYRLDLAIDSLLDTTTGTITSKTNGINQSIAAIETKRQSINRRLTQIEARYRKQFNALDSAVANMQQTSQYLTQQLAKLSSSNQ